MSPRKRTTVRLTNENYTFVCELARVNESDLNAELNRLVREERRRHQHDAKVTPTSSSSTRLQ